VRIRLVLAIGLIGLTAVVAPRGFAQAPASGQAAPASPPERVALARQLVSASDDEARAALLAASPALRQAGLAADVIVAVQDSKSLPPQAAGHLYTFARQLAADLHDADGAAYAAINLGIIQGQLSRYDAALVLFEEARTGAREAGATKREAQALTNICVLHRRRGDLDLAFGCYQETLALYARMGSLDQQATLLNNFGALEVDRGDYRAALDLFEKSLAIKQRLNAPGAELAITLNNIGTIYAHQDDSGLALTYYQRALAAVAGSQNETALMQIYNHLGNLYVQLERYDEAIAQLNRAADIAERTNDRRGLASVLYNIATFQVAERKPAEAVATFERSLALREQASERHGIAESLLGLSAVLADLGRPDEARSRAARSVDIAKEMGDLPVLWGALGLLGDLEAALGHREAAEKNYRDAIDVVEQLRLLTVGGAHQQQQAFSARFDPYRRLVTLLAEAGRTEDALLTLERARARTLLDVLQQGEPAFSPVMTPAETQRERALNQAFVVVSKTLAAKRGSAPANDPRMRDLVANVQAARRDLDDFHVQLDAAHPELRARRGEVPALSSADLDSLLPSDSSAAVEYISTDKLTYAFVARRLPAGTLRLTVHRLLITRDDLHTRAADFRRRVAQRDLNIRPAARQLYDDLLAPLAADLDGATDWTIVPDQELWEVPFQALLGPDGRYVVERAATSLVPSLGALRAMQTPRSQQRGAHPRAALVIGSAGSPTAGLTSLAEAEGQARTIGRVYGAGAQVVTGTNANKSRFALGSGQFAVIHIASHGVLDDAGPMHSYVSLSPLATDGTDTGMLEAGELMQMRLGADLVVLSGCETGRGRSSNGEGLIGLSWALFAAGTPSAVASQWKVDAVSTTALMTDFHRAINAEWLTSGHVRGRALALQQAALKMLRGGAYTHPFYWAPFVVMGNGS